MGQRVDILILAFLGLIVLFFIIVVVFLVSLFFSGDGGVEYSSAELEKCTRIREVSDEGINVVLFADKKEDAEKYINYFLGFAPFNEHKDRFNFYYIGGYKPVCELYNGIAILCYSRELVKKAGSCPNDHIVVLNEEMPRSIRSSNYLNVLSINTKHPMSVFMHEFGHSFVNFAEEYVPAKIPRNSAGNCAVDCSEFGGKEDGCYAGCSLDNYQRSVENGVMRTLSSEYFGSFNDNVLADKIDSLEPEQSSGIVGRAIGIAGRAIDGQRECIKEKYYLIEARYIEGRVEVLSKTIEEGCIGDSGDGAYSFNVGGVSGSFNPVDIFTDAPNDDPSGPAIDGEIFRGDTFYLKVPILEDSDILEISTPEGQKTDIILGCDSLAGDSNGDGVVDSIDANHIKDYLSGGILNCGENADLDNNGKIDVIDAAGLTGITENKNIQGGIISNQSNETISNASVQNESGQNITVQNASISDSNSSSQSYVNQSSGGQSVILSGNDRFLVLHMSFDEGSGNNAYDTSAGGNNGNIYGASWVAGKSGGALEFNAEDDSVFISDSNSLDLTTAGTWMAWVYPTALKGGWAGIIQKQVDIYFLHAGSNAGALIPAMGTFRTSSGYDLLYATGQIPVGQWTHLAGTYDNTNFNLYVNGAKVGSKITSGSLQVNSNPVRIGNNTYGEENFLGLIDEVRIYNVSLSDSEILEVYNS